jgi:hypothetical protein
MVRIWIFAGITAVVFVSAFGCGQLQGAGNAESREPPTTTTEETTYMSEVECPSGEWQGGQLDYAAGAKGEKGNPVELARRDFSKKIREADKVEVAQRSGGMATVHVIREGLVVAHIEYRRAGGSWLQDSYEACVNF